MTILYVFNISLRRSKLFSASWEECITTTRTSWDNRSEKEVSAAAHLHSSHNSSFGQFVAVPGKLLSGHCCHFLSTTHTRIGEQVELNVAYINAIAPVSESVFFLMERPRQERDLESQTWKQPFIWFNPPRIAVPFPVSQSCDQLAPFESSPVTRKTAL